MMRLSSWTDADAAALHDAFMELGLLARGEGKVIDLAV